jgi:hypothetical protein
MLLERILKVAPPDTIIPKPKAKGDFIVKGQGIRRGKPAVIYTIPNHKRPNKPYEKGINAAELEAAHNQLLSSGSLTRQWFKKELPKCDYEGKCNFTTVGGLFVLLGEAVYANRGTYQKV